MEKPDRWRPGVEVLPPLLYEGDAAAAAGLRLARGMEDFGNQ